MYTKVTNLVKSDIKELPFEEIDIGYHSILAEKVRQAKLRQFTLTGEGSEEGSLEGGTEGLPLETFQVEANTESVNSFVARYGIKDSWEWLSSQLLAHLATYRVPSHSSTQKIDPIEFLATNIGRSQRELGIYRMLTKVPRGTLMDRQTQKQHLPVCSLVPVYMAAQKKYNDIRFSNWSATGLEHLVDKDLYAAMTAPQPQGPVPASELLKIRAAGLMYKSTSKKTLGQLKSYSPETYHVLRNVKDSAIGNLPRLAQAMLAQIWVAHPINRHRYMVLDPYNWDNVPDPLVAQNVFTATTTYHKDTPW